MKKIILSLTLLFSAYLGYAAPPKKTAGFVRPYGMAGCGLGSQLIGKGGGQVFASTTNNSSESQLFGITSGTSNCIDNPNDEVASRMDHFVGGNTVAIANDIARGDGETLVGLSQLMGCPNGNELGITLQRSFHAIFPSSKVTPNEVTDSIISVIKGNVELAQSCKRVI